MIPTSAMITTSPLSSVSIRFANEQVDFIAGNVFPEVVQDKKTFKVWQYDTSNMRRRVSKKANNTPADMVAYSGFYTARTSEPHKLGTEWDPADTKDLDAVVADVENDGAMTVMESLLIDREVEAATLATTSTNYPADLTSALISGTDTWVDAGGDPRGNAKTARIAVKARTGKTPNAMAISWTGFEHLQQNPALLDFLKYTSGQSISIEQLKGLLGVKYIFIGAAQYNSNMEGNSTQTLSDIWNDSALFFIYDPSQRLRKVCYGQGYYRNQLYSYRYEDPTRGSGDGRIQLLEQGWNYIQCAGSVVSSSDSDFTGGYLFRNVF